MFQTFVLLTSLVAVGAIAQAGDITGNVAAAKGISVVYVDAVPGKTFPAPAVPLEMDQKSLAFQPHVIVAPVGSTVEFLNSDKVAHNIFWPAINGNKKLGHNLGTWPTGEKRSFRFDNPGIVALLCNVHPEMSGYVVVTPTPFYAQTDGAGAFKIANVPPGSYTLTVWHEGSKSQSKPVTVAAAGEAKVDFTVGK